MRERRRSEWSRIAAIGASLGAVAIALLTLAGWALGIGLMVRIDPAAPLMAPLTAALVVLAGLTIRFGFPLTAPGGPIHPERERAIRTGGALALLLLVGARAAAARLAPGLDLDSFGFEVAGFAPPRMSATTGAALGLLAAALLVAGRLRESLVFDVLALVAGLVGWLGLSAYLFGGDPLLPFRQLSLRTSLSVILLCAAAVAARRDAGLGALLVADSAGGYAARHLVPAALALPIAMGWLRLQAQRAGWFGTEAGLALFALANVVVFGGLIWAVARQLHDADRGRLDADTRTLVELHHLQLLEQITRSIAQHADLRSIHQIVLDALRERLVMDFAAVCDFDAAAGRLRVRLVTMRGGGGPLLAAGAVFPIDGNGLRRAVGGELVCEPDLTRCAQPLAAVLAASGLRSLAVAPLVVERRVMGVLLCARRAPDAFTSRECEFLKQLSDHVALAVHQQHLLQSLQRAYDELRETQRVAMQQERLRVLGQMASGIAHDINNALTPALLLMETLLEDEQAISESSREAIVVVQRSIQDASTTLERLREFYRPRDASRVAAPLDLNAVSGQALALASVRWKRAPGGGAAIETLTELAAGLPTVRGIESEIREALTNLLFNAVDAMPDGGTVTLRTRVLEPGRLGPAAPTTRPAVALEVEDTGTGMDEKTRARCLEPFFTTKGERGTGLGLAMVYGIVQRHGADLEIDSAPGRGTIVRLVLPTEPPRAGEVEPAAAAPPAAGPPPPVRVLSVDDDPVLLETLRGVLERDGHRVTTASGGAEGIDRFREAAASADPFAVAIVDLGMPRVDGLQVAEAVKQLSPGTPVVLLTGWGKELADEGELPPHIDVMLAKPPRLDELRAALARVLPPRAS